MGLIDEAIARRDARPEPRRIDYDRMNRVHPKQKAALTRAVNRVKQAGGDQLRWGDEPSQELLAARENLAKVCKAAVEEWNEIGAWPDDWARWRNALNDTLPLSQQIELEDL